MTTSLKRWLLLAFIALPFVFPASSAQADVGVGVHFGPKHHHHHRHHHYQH